MSDITTTDTATLKAAIAATLERPAKVADEMAERQKRLADVTPSALERDQFLHGRWVAEMNAAAIRALIQD